MSEGAGVTDRLDSWKEIAAYVGRDVRTVIRWEQRGRLPVYRIPVGQRQAVYAFRHEIDEWMAGATPGSLELGAALEVAAARPDWNQEAAVAVATPAASAVDRKRTGSRTWIRIAAGLAIAGFAILIFPATRWLLSPQQIDFTNVAQITSDGTTKEALVTDGRNLFFNEDRHGRLVMASVSADGGAVRFIASPFVKAFPQAVSHDGKSLLVLASIGQETEKTLWILPVSGGEPTRVGHILSHEAAWSPDGRKIAYAYGNALYLTDNQGESVKELQTFRPSRILPNCWNGSRTERAFVFNCAISARGMGLFGSCLFPMPKMALYPLLLRCISTSMPAAMRPQPSIQRVDRSWWAMNWTQAVSA